MLKKLKLFLTSTALFSFLVSSLALPVLSQTITTSTLDIYGKAKSINSLKEVLVLVNPVQDPNDMNPPYHAGIWKDDVFTQYPEDFGTQDPFESTSNLNDSQEIVGTEFRDGSLRAFIYRSTGREYLDTTLGISGLIETKAYAINNNSQVVGTYRVQNESFNHLYVWQNGAVTLIENPFFSSTNITPKDINDNGVIVGYTDTGAFMYDLSSQTVTTIGDPNHTQVQPQSINDAGEVVGNANTLTYTAIGFIWAPGASSLEEIQALGSTPDPMGGSVTYTSAYSINETGQVVGISSATDGGHAFLREANGTMVDLGVVDSLSIGSEALCINEAGFIVGTNFSSDPTGPAYYPVIWDYVVTKQKKPKKIKKIRQAIKKIVKAIRSARSRR